MWTDRTGIAVRTGVSLGAYCALRAGCSLRACWSKRTLRAGWPLHPNRPLRSGYPLRSDDTLWAGVASVTVSTLWTLRSRRPNDALRSLGALCPNGALWPLSSLWALRTDSTLRTGVAGFSRGTCRSLHSQHGNEDFIRLVFVNRYNVDKFFDVYIVRCSNKNFNDVRFVFIDCHGSPRVLQRTVL